MDLNEALYTTRAMRRVKPDPIPDEIVARMLDGDGVMREVSGMAPETRLKGSYDIYEQIIAPEGMRRLRAQDRGHRSPLPGEIRPDGSGLHSACAPPDVERPDRQDSGEPDERQPTEGRAPLPPCHDEVHHIPPAPPVTIPVRHRPASGRPNERRKSMPRLFRREFAGDDPVTHALDEGERRGLVA